MKKNFLRHILFLAALWSVNNSHSQIVDFSEINNQFKSYREQVLQEKIYAHLDKPSYLAGEILWFKLYNVDASFHKRVDVSKVVYIEILDADQNAVLQTKVSLQDGTGHGSLLLPPTIHSGNYVFRAYTNWMKNFNTDFYFEKGITIINSLTAQVPPAKTTQLSYDLQFFPEGGNLVEGIESTVGVRLVNQDGIGTGYKAFVVDANNDTIVNFQPLKFGIGSFRLQPSVANNYRAVVQLDNGYSFSKELPKALAQGYVLHLKKSPDGKVQVLITSTENFNNQTVHLLVHTRQQLVVSQNLSIVNGKAEIVIEEAKMGEGISHFTIFDAAKNALCERLFFKHPTKKLIINASPGNNQYESRKKVSIDLDATTESGRPQQTNMSLSVYKIDSSFSSQQNILSYLWLSSDLKGNIESPDYYFTNSGKEVEEAVDNLMLTHGWRRFIWKDILHNKPLFPHIPEYEGHIVSAIVTNKLTGERAPGIHGFLSIPDSNFQFYTALSDSQGKVNFFTKNFFGVHEILAQAGGRTRDYRLEIKAPYSENYSSRKLPEFSFSNISGAAIQAGSISMQVQNIYAADKLNKLYNLSSDTAAFFVPTRTYVLDDYVRFPTMEEVLREYVQEVAVIKQNNTLSLAAGRRDAAGILYRYEPLVLIDGVPLFDNPHKVFGFDPLKVEELQVMNQKYFLGTSTFEGILNFKTYSGKPEGLESDPNATVLDYEGLQLQREFFAPVYETQNQVASRLPDFRNLLHWAPSVSTDASGKHQLSFYTSDLPGKYMVLIEGLSNDGRAGSKTFMIEVVNPLFVQK